MKAWYPGIFGLFFATCFTSTTWATDCSQEIIWLNTQAHVDSFQNDFGDGGTCDTVTVSLIIIGPDISNLDALSDLTAIGGDLDIQENDALVNIDSLSKLTGLGNDLFIGSKCFTDPHWSQQPGQRVCGCANPGKSPVDRP